MSMSHLACCRLVRPAPAYAGFPGLGTSCPMHAPYVPDKGMVLLVSTNGRPTVMHVSPLCRRTCTQTRTCALQPAPLLACPRHLAHTYTRTEKHQESLYLSSTRWYWTSSVLSPYRASEGLLSRRDRTNFWTCEQKTQTQMHSRTVTLARTTTVDHHVCNNFDVHVGRGVQCFTGMRRQSVLSMPDH